MDDIHLKLSVFPVRFYDFGCRIFLLQKIFHPFGNFNRQVILGIILRIFHRLDQNSLRVVIKIHFPRALLHLQNIDRLHAFAFYHIHIVQPPLSVFAVLKSVFDGFGQSRIRQVRFGHQPNGTGSKPCLGIIIPIPEIRNVIITPGFPFRTGFRIFLRKRRLQFFGNFQVVIIVITTLHNHSAYS